MNVYVHPWSATSSGASRNPYMRQFIASLAPDRRVVNGDAPTSTGLFGVVPWLRHLDVLVLHWSGDISDRRGATAQIALLRAILAAKSRLGLRVVDVLHNRISHTATRWRAKQYVVGTVLRHADMVLTHAQDGVAFALETCPSTRGKIHCLPHPMDPSRPFIIGDEPFDSRPHDILVWGRLSAYKGLDDFLNVLSSRGIERRYRILVAGQSDGAALTERLSTHAPSIVFDNGFIPDDELRRIMAASKIILFPYRPETVIGSSSLMDALSSDAIVIGPRAGAFRDCGDLGLISTFATISELPGVIDRALASDRTGVIDKRRAFAAAHTWDAFGRAFSTMLSRLPAAR